jgi:hypothetical protein
MFGTHPTSPRSLRPHRVEGGPTALAKVSTASPHGGRPDCTSRSSYRYKLASSCRCQDFGGGESSLSTSCCICSPSASIPSCSTCNFSSTFCAHAAVAACRQPPPAAAGAGREHTVTGLLLCRAHSYPSVAQRELQTVRVEVGGGCTPACEQATRSSSGSALRCSLGRHHCPATWAWAVRLETKARGPAPVLPPVLQPACPQTGEQVNTAVYRPLTTRRQRGGRPTRNMV